MRRNITAVIPTRDRPADLGMAVASILAQRRLPDELLIVDQSRNTESRSVVDALFTNVREVRLTYIHDPQIAGLVEAKQVAATRARGDIVCFLEDDVVLEPAFLAEIDRGFDAAADMMGCSGIIKNKPNESAAYVALHRMFFRGVFRDPRAGLSGDLVAGSASLVRCDVMWGGLSAWKKEVFDAVPFDTVNGFHMLEDIEFSTRVVRRLGHCLYVNRAARLEHHFSPVNRDAHGPRQRRKLTESVMFFKTRRSWEGAKRGFILVLVWWFAEALHQSARTRSTRPLRGYFAGIADGLKKKLI